MRAVVAAVALIAAIGQPVAALDCGTPHNLAFLERQGPLPEGVRRAIVDWSVASMLQAPVAFEGRLVREVSLPRDGGNFRETLLEFRNVFWLKGPDTGRRDHSAFVLRVHWCDGGCAEPRRVVVHGVRPHSPETVFVANWSPRSELSQARRRFGVAVRYMIGICDREIVGRSAHPEEQAALDGAIRRMREEAQREARSLEGNQSRGR